MTDHRQTPPVGHVDYDERVAFPVEIVGGDGVVRRHPFLSAVGLYERRIVDTLMLDPEGHDAPVARHCVRRIQQLRTSFFLTHGWGANEPEGTGEALFGHFAGQVAGLLATLFPLTGALDVRVRNCPDREGVYQVDYLLVPISLSLHVATRESSRARFGVLADAAEKELSPIDEECFVGATVCRDGCAIITAQPSTRVTLLGLMPPTAQIVEVEQTPWTQVADALGAEDYSRALALCRSLIDDHVYHRRAYQTAALIAAYSNQTEQVEDLCVLGLSQWTGDADLRSVSALHAWKLREREQARQHVAAIVGQAWRDAGVLRTLVGLGDEASQHPTGSPDGMRLTRLLHRLRSAAMYLKYVGGFCLSALTFMLTGDTAHALTVFLAVWVVLHITCTYAREQAEHAAFAHLLNQSVRTALLQRLEHAPQSILPS